MALKRFGSSVRGKQAKGKEKPMPDSAIDFSDIPGSTYEELRTARRVGRPRSPDAKLLIAIRIRASLLAKIRKAAQKKGKPYQTLIHEILEKSAGTM
jgi:uncharacterized protein (DUF4415 family)